MREFRGQFAVVGEQQHARGVAVEPSDGIDSLGTSVLHEFHHSLTVLRVVARGDGVFRLIEQHIDLLLHRDGLVVELHRVGAHHFRAEFLHHLTVHRDNSGLNEIVGLASAANAGIGQKFVQTHRFVGVDVCFLVFDAFLHAVFRMRIVVGRARTVAVAVVTALLTVATLLSVVARTIALLTRLVAVAVVVVARTIALLTWLITFAVVVVTRTIAMLSRLIAFAVVIVTRAIALMTGLITTALSIVVVARTILLARLIAVVVVTRAIRLLCLLQPCAESLGAESLIVATGAAAIRHTLRCVDTWSLWFLFKFLFHKILIFLSIIYNKVC